MERRKTQLEKFKELKPQTFISFCAKCRRKTPQTIYQDFSKVKYSLRCLRCGKVKQGIFTAEKLYSILEEQKEVK